MDKLVLFLPILLCGIMMAVMMLMMRLGHGQPDKSIAPDKTAVRREIASLRAELEVLRSGKDEQQGVTS